MLLCIWIEASNEQDMKPNIPVFTSTEKQIARARGTPLGSISMIQLSAPTYIKGAAVV